MENDKKISSAQFISEMGEIMQETEKMIHELSNIQEKWNKHHMKYSQLMDYYFSKQWQKDMQADEDNYFGDISKGVLSEDGVYNLNGEMYYLALAMMRTAFKYIDNEATE